MTRLIREEDILDNAHEVVLLNKSKKMVFDVTLVKELPEVEAIPLDWIRQWHQRRVSGRKNYKAATTMVIRELLDAWDAERDKE